MTSRTLPLYASMIFLTVGPAATQCGHWKSMNSMIVTGAFSGPSDGALSMGIETRLSAEKAVPMISRSNVMILRAFFMVDLQEKRRGQASPPCDSTFMTSAVQCPFMEHRQVHHCKAVGQDNGRNEP